MVVEGEPQLNRGWIAGPWIQMTPTSGGRATGHTHTFLT